MARKRERGEAENRLALGRQREEARFPAAPAKAGLPRDYPDALGAIKRRIREERLRVVLAANAAMVLLYWDIGRMILERQDRAGWGAKVIDRLAADLREAFPDMKGFSPRNLKYMRAFAAAWPERAIVQEALAQIPWYHHIALLEKLDDTAERLWYARQAMEQGWSQNILMLQIHGRAHERQGKPITNFRDTLPPAESDLAAEVFKDPHLFAFLGTADPRREREIEQAPFDPAFVGQLNLYPSAADDLLRHPDDQPTTGLLLCRAKNKVVVEYALHHLKRPIGVAGWETKLVEKLPKALKGSLPTVEEIDAELSGDLRPTSRTLRRKS